MLNKQFESHKIKREIKQHGKKYTFYRKMLNDFGELADEEKEVAIINALYHEENSHVYLTTDNSNYTQSRSKKIPNLLCIFDDVKDLKANDTVKINDKTFKVTAIVNIQEWSIIADVCMEVIDDGFPN